MMIFKMSSYAFFDFWGKVPKNSDFQNGRCQFGTLSNCFDKHKVFFTNSGMVIPFLTFILTFLAAKVNKARMNDSGFQLKSTRYIGPTHGQLLLPYHAYKR